LEATFGAGASSYASLVYFCIPGIRGSAFSRELV
jgi:hypothetical protein